MGDLTLSAHRGLQKSPGKAEFSGLCSAYRRDPPRKLKPNSRICCPAAHSHLTAPALTLTLTQMRAEGPAPGPDPFSALPPRGHRVVPVLDQRGRAQKASIFRPREVSTPALSLANPELKRYSDLCVLGSAPFPWWLEKRQARSKEDRSVAGQGGGPLEPVISLAPVTGCDPSHNPDFFLEFRKSPVSGCLGPPMGRACLRHK
ncbi:uncharacterized protein LOC117285705 isoform X2 [Fukomys damarensis]|uniref:uncharacterized protein LOC117285705 isoform X2 n=1 Tax=Fukomys damarensis TaxID=885580 RepID=UPI001455B724|nr:uncharacterized protein LOC117285705 isoform X2 [Fukomys damarensis]